MGKRGNGEGSIFRFGKKWRASISVPGPDGKRVRKTKTCETRADAVAALQILRSEASTSPPEKCELTVGQLLRQWIKNNTPNWSENTRSQKTWIVSDWIERADVCHILAVDLQPQTVRTLLADLKEKRKASGRVLQLVRSALLNAYNQANQDKTLATNPILGIRKPPSESSDIFPFTEDEVRGILASVRGSPYYAAFVLAFTIGLRVGELCGLRREHFNNEQGTLLIAEQLIEVDGKIVRKKPKTVHSLRTVELPNVARAALAEHCLKLDGGGKRANDSLFPNRDGGPTRRTNFVKWHWKPVLERLGLAHRGFHHCRHTYATLALRRGVPVTVVSKILGHASPEITYRIYAHYIPGDQRLSIAAMDGLILGGSSVATQPNPKST